MDFISGHKESYYGDKQEKRQLFACVRKFEGSVKVGTPVCSLSHQLDEKNLIAKSIFK
jgi:hypothetical protein